MRLRIDLVGIIGVDWLDCLGCNSSYWVYRSLFKQREMKKTAIDWLIEQWPILESDLPPWLIEQAKAMEKEQIIEAWDNGYANGYDLGKHDDQPNPDDAEQYYNETFKEEQ